jgi:hypothetical protein
MSVLAAMAALVDLPLLSLSAIAQAWAGLLCPACVTALVLLARTIKGSLCFRFDVFLFFKPI